MQIKNWKEIETWVTPQDQPEVDIKYFDGNPLKYHYFMALFSEIGETKTDDPRLIKYKVAEPKEQIKHCIQLPYDCGYHTTVTLLKKLIAILTKYHHHIEGT